MRKRSSDNLDDDARADARTTMDAAWGTTRGGAWQSPGAVEAWIPTTNTWQNACFAEHAEWLRRKVEEAAQERADMRAYPRDPEWRQRQEREMHRPAGSPPLTHDLIAGLHGRQRQQAHAKELLAAIGAAHDEGDDKMVDQPEGNEPSPQQIAPASGTVATMHETDAAIYLSVSTRKLRRMRQHGEGPAHYKIGGSVRYAKDDLDRYVAAQRRDPMAA